MLDNLLNDSEFKTVFDQNRPLDPLIKLNLRGVDPAQLSSKFWDYFSAIRHVEFEYNSVEVLDFSSCPKTEIWVDSDRSYSRPQKVILPSSAKKLKLLYGPLPEIEAGKLKELFLHEVTTSDLDLSYLTDLESIKFCGHKVSTLKLPASVKKITVYGDDPFPQLSGDITHLSLARSLDKIQKDLDLSELHCLKEISFNRKTASTLILPHSQVVVKGGENTQNLVCKSHDHAPSVKHNVGAQSSQNVDSTDRVTSGKPKVSAFFARMNRLF